MRGSVMHLYTIILDYAGGTYVAQTKAMSANAAFRVWVSKPKWDRIADVISEDVAAAFAASDDEALLLDGLTAVWCASAPARQGLAVANIVQTVA